MSLFGLSAKALIVELKAGRIKPTEAVSFFLDRIGRLDPRLNSFLDVFEEDALSAAEQVEGRYGASDELPLFGLPVAVKDNICTAGHRTTCASRLLESFTSPYDATAVRRLREAGAVIIGKTNLDEFAMGSSTENSAFGSTLNPRDTSRVAGGSSGGSAACVAANLAPAALGTDTGGSIRQPASFCGVVGFKPTYGRVSRYGLVAFASSLDQIGSIATTVEDAALLYSVIAGYDAHDSTSLDLPVNFSVADLDEKLDSLVIGIPREFFAGGCDGAVHDAVMNAAREFERRGARLVDVSLPHSTDYAIAAYYIIAPAEASSNLARYDGVRYGLRVGSDDLLGSYLETRSTGFGDEVKRRIMLGTFVLSAGYYEAYYLKAMKVRTLVKQDFASAFESCDVLFTPVSPTTAFELGEKLDDPLKMYLSDIYTLSVNLAGLPAISVPCGQDSSGLPIGLQVIGPVLEDARVLRVARMWESEFGTVGCAFEE